MDVGSLRQPGETLWEWSSRHAAPEVQRGRALVDRWLQPLSNHLRSRFLTRLQSNDDYNFESALFELTIHALLSSCGYELVPEPESGHGSVPDFLITQCGEVVCYLEATLDRGQDAQRRADDRVYRLLEDAGAYVKCTGFCVSVESFTVGRGNPSPRRLGKFLQEWLSTTSHAAVVAGGVDGLPTRRYEDSKSGWVLELEIVPLKDAALQPERIWATLSTGEVSYVDPDGRLRRAIRGKSRQHRGVAHPVVVAIARNDPLGPKSDDDVVSALLGTPYWSFPRSGKGEGHMGRHADGIWSTQDSATSRQISGVLITSACSIHGIPDIDPCLWNNPWRDSRILERWPFRSVAWNSQTGDPVRHNGERPSKILAASERARNEASVLTLVNDEKGSEGTLGGEM